MQQLAEWLSAVLGSARGAPGELRAPDSDQHGEIDPPLDHMDRTDSLAFLLKHAMDLITTALNGTEAQVLCFAPRSLCLPVYLATAEPTDVLDCVAKSQNELQKRFKPSITKATARLTLTQVPEVQFNSQALMRATPSYETKHPGERSG